MPSPLQRLGHVFLRRLCFLARGERTDPFHQIQAQLQTKLVRLARGELPARSVLREAFLGTVSRLPDVERCERTRLLRAGAGEFDDVDGIAPCR